MCSSVAEALIKQQSHFVVPILPGQAKSMQFLKASHLNLYHVSLKTRNESKKDY